MRRCKVSEAAVALALTGQGGKLHNKQGAGSRGICGFLALFTSLGLLAPDYSKGVPESSLVLCDGLFLRLGHFQSLISGRYLLFQGNEANTIRSSSCLSSRLLLLESFASPRWFQGLRF